ncbi:acyl carrier protein, partial [Mycolicibacterium litorale]
MTSLHGEDAVRQWLVDYLVTNVGCSPDEIDGDAPLSDLAVGSADAVMIAGELSELLGRSVSPVEFWQYPTINTLARFLSGAQHGGEEETGAGGGHRWADEPVAVVGVGCRFPGGVVGAESLWGLLIGGG